VIFGRIKQGMIKLNKFKKGDKVAILSPSFAAPGKWPHVYELGLKRLIEVFELEPVEFPATKKLGASQQERANDLIAAFENPDIKGVISSLGGDDQITYIKNLPPEPFRNNPKPYFGYSDNTHFMNFLWLNGIPSYYGGALFTQFAEQGKIHDFTLKYLTLALCDEGEIELEASKEYNDVGLNWNDPENLNKQRSYEPNAGWVWDGNQNAEGITWGGCLESIDEILRHGVAIPSLEQFERV
jgi:muramoyltetrapeptide carboxypeptidase LdcA involved in peptidoglycan recycling